MGNSAKVQKGTRFCDLISRFSAAFSNVQGSLNGTHLGGNETLQMYGQV